MKHTKALLALILASATLIACTQTPAPTASETIEIETLSNGNGNGNGNGRGRPIVGEPTPTPTPTPVSACTALYSSPAAQATLTNAMIDPALTYGSVGTLILSFNTPEVLEAAAQSINSTLGLQVGSGLGVFTSLPMIALEAPITPGLISTLTSNLQGYGLLSIYQDRPLQYFLSTSADYIGAPAARADFGVSGRGVGVAVLDSGVDGLQGDFSNMVRNVKIIASILNVGVGGYLTVDTPNSDPTSGHGTHVAGTIGGTGAMSDGRYTGIAPGANLVGIGAGDALFILYALQGYDFALNPNNREAHNIRIISNSWGSSGRFAPFHPINIASKRAYDDGVIVAFAAGNAGPEADTLNPYSASPCVISVAAGDKNGNLANFSSRGIPGDEFHQPDITAPGVQIIAARATTGAVTPPFTGDLQYGAFYSSISGTSMATPHISGVIALMLEANPTLTMDETLAILKETARPMAGREAWEVGAGYVDAYAAVQRAAAGGNGVETVTQELARWNGSVGLSVVLPVGGSLAESVHNFNLNVPAGVQSLSITTDWGNPALDLDLYVYGPDGSLVASSAGIGETFEAVTIPSPVSGTYRSELRGYLNTPTSYEGVAIITTTN